MSETKHHREKRRQLGQFMTPLPLVREVLSRVSLSREMRILEPGFGDGSFITGVVERLLPQGSHEDIGGHLDDIFSRTLWGIEIDPTLYAGCFARLQAMWGYRPSRHHLCLGDYFTEDLATDCISEFVGFDLIVGNPPFGGTIDLNIQDALDAQYGRWNGHKVKKETYSFFIMRSIDYLAAGGRLLFLCSDTFLTIATMQGLRRRLAAEGSVNIRRLRRFSDETVQPMVVLDFQKGKGRSLVVVDGSRVRLEDMERTGNFSWQIGGDHAQYFQGATLGDVLVCTSGMTIGKNDWFVRNVSDGSIVEPFRFEFYEKPITLAGELERARLHRLSPKAIERAKEQEMSQATRRCVRLMPREVPLKVRLPHPDYRYYNKGVAERIFSPPRFAVYWKDQGDAVMTYKKSGKWYLHGVGGKPYFGREGLSWQLISPRLNTRYLPPGFILDSSAPTGFLRDGVPRDELWFLLGWMCSRLCNTILKTVLNHTRNIQSKDVERLPYPFWVNPDEKSQLVQMVAGWVHELQNGAACANDDPRWARLEHHFRFVSGPMYVPQVASGQPKSLGLGPKLSTD